MVNLRHQFRAVNGIRQHLVIAGTGPMLILLHGFPECWVSWRRMIPFLAERFRVIAPDTRGVGETEIGGPYDLETLGRDLAALIDQEGGEAVLVGHDWGGVIAWHTASVFPEKVKALVAVAGPHPGRYAELLYKNPIQFIKAYYTLLFQIPRFPEWLLSRGGGRVLEELIRLTRMVEPEAGDIATLRAMWSDKRRLRAGLDYYRAHARVIHRSPGFYKAHLVQCPALAIMGERDSFLVHDQARGLEKFAISPPRLEILKDRSHWAPMEAPEELAKLILDFV